MYIKLNNNTAIRYSLAQLKKDNPSVSFPATQTAQLLLEYNVVECLEDTLPDHNPLTHSVIKAAQPVETDGVWTWDWDVVELDSDTKADNIRRERNNLLGDTDWWAVQDRTMSQAERDYRQALRDITDQPTFPDSVVWPTEV